MRVLYDHQVFSRQSAGGASRYFYELARYCSSLADVKCELLMGFTSSVYPFQKLSSESTRVLNFRGTGSYGAARYLVNEVAGNCVAALLGTVDVYHPTLYRRMPLVRARQVVATHHDCTQERYPEAFRYSKQVRRAKAALYKRADAIICVSESCRNDLFDFYAVDPAKTRVIHHGLTRLPRSKTADQRLRRTLQRDYLLYVGSRAPYKNFSGLLEAFHSTGLCNSMQLLVIGGGQLRRDEMLLPHTLGVSEHLVCLPEASDEILAAAYAGATATIYPSFYEGFGLPPLEAMDAGCPVVASATSSIPEICGDAPFYFDPANQDSLHCQLLTAVCDNTARDRAVLRGRKVAAKYSWSKCGEQTVAVYHES